MLALGLVRDVALLGILEGRGHVAGRGHLLLHAGDLALAWFFSQKRRADEEVFRRATCAVQLRHCGCTGPLGSSAVMEVLWTDDKNTGFLAEIIFFS